MSWFDVELLLKAPRSFRSRVLKAWIFLGLSAMALRSDLAPVKLESQTSDAIHAVLCAAGLSGSTSFARKYDPSVGNTGDFG